MIIDGVLLLNIRREQLLEMANKEKHEIIGK
jgi:hypothetical protein